MDKEVAETFANFQKKISSFQANIHKLNVREVTRRSRIMEYHYKEIIHNLQQIHYHMEQIENHCKTTMEEPPQKPPRLEPKQPADLVRNRIKQFDDVRMGKGPPLSPGFLEQDLKEFRSVHTVLQKSPQDTRPLRKTSGASKSMENLTGNMELMAVNVDMDKKYSLENLVDSKRDDDASRKYSTIGRGSQSFYYKKELMGTDIEDHSTRPKIVSYMLKKQPLAPTIV